MTLVVGEMVLTGETLLEEASDELLRLDRLLVVEEEMLELQTYIEDRLREKSFERLYE